MHYSHNYMPPKTDPALKHVFARASGKLVMTTISDEIGRTLGRNIFAVCLCRYLQKLKVAQESARRRRDAPTYANEDRGKGRPTVARSLTGKRKKERLAAGPCMYDLRRVDADVCSDCKNPIMLGKLTPRYTKQTQW